MRISIALGFYDEDGIFFYEWENARPNEHYSYALAGAPERYVLRINGHDINENEEEYHFLLRKAHEGAFDALP